MTGIQFVTDERGERTAVVIDLKIHGELWNDLQDVLVSRERKSEENIPMEEVRAELVRSGKLREEVRG